LVIHAEAIEVGISEGDDCGSRMDRCWPRADRPNQRSALSCFGWWRSPVFLAVTGTAARQYSSDPAPKIDAALGAAITLGIG